MAKIKIEGNTLTLDDDVVATDKKLRDALAPFYPAVANATIKREKKEGETTITVTKQAGSKGAGDLFAVRTGVAGENRQGAFGAVLTALDQAPETIAPILMLDVGGPGKASKGQVDNAILQMLDEELAVQRMTNALEDLEAQGAHATPRGF